MKILTQFLTSLIFSIIFGIFSLLAGSGIGGNYGFPDFGGNVGYEASGAFFGVIGISLGALVGSLFTRKLQKEKTEILSAIIAMTISLSFGLLNFEYNMTPMIAWLILLLPSLLITVATNRKERLILKK